MTFQMLIARRWLLLHMTMIMLVSFLACTGEDLSGFEIEQQSKQITVKGKPGNVILPVDAIPDIPLTLDLQSELQDQNAADAKAVYLRVLDLNLTDKAMPEGDKDDFDFLERIEIYVESTKEGSALTRQKIADLETIPPGVKRLQLKTYDNIDLKPYIDEGLKFTTSATGTLPPDDTSLRAQVMVRVQIL